MPNWCSKALTINGPQQILDEVRAVFNEEGICFDLFSRWLPMPPPLQDVRLGFQRVHGRDVTRWREHLIDGERVVIPLDTDEELALIDRYGAADWRQWSMRHWGCKWDTDAEIFEVPDGVTLRFDTPWSPPFPFVEHLCQHLGAAAVVVELAYSESGVGFWGRIRQ